MKLGSEFYSDSRLCGGLHNVCKACYFTAAKARYRANHTEYFERHLRNAYGLTFGQYKIMWGAQKGKCAICKRDILLGPAPDQKSWTKYAVVDHCHTTEKVQALYVIPVIGLWDIWVTRQNVRNKWPCISAAIGNNFYGTDRELALTGS